MKAKISKNSGFSLIELLIVIGIIGVLASFILIANGRSKVQSRDARRVEDMREIYNALQLYYTNVEEYPPDCSAPGYAGGCDKPDQPYSGIMADSSSDGEFVQFLTPDFLGDVYGDPLNGAENFYFYTTDTEYPSGSGDFYRFLVGVRLEDASNNTSGITPPSGMEDYYILGEKE
jgi:prepilin-type N-terminal cleavage/methylation domain-containing protein